MPCFIRGYRTTPLKFLEERDYIDDDRGFCGIQSASHILACHDIYRLTSERLYRRPAYRVRRICGQVLPR